MGLTALFQAPVTVRIIPSDTDPTGLGDVLLRSLGLTGVLALVALVFGVLFAAILFAIRSRSS